MIKKIILVMLVLMNVSCSSESRKPAYSGSFYPGDKKELETMIKSYMDKAILPDLQGEITGIIVPHAGYIFSGPVAAYGYNAIKGKDIKTVIILAQSHRFALDYAAVYDKGSFLTPLGEVKINEALAEKIIKSNNLFKPDAKPHSEEHSIEVQVPFLQEALKDFTIVPVLLGPFDANDCESIGKSIAEALKGEKNYVIVISTDLSHYPGYEDEKKIDTEILNKIAGMNIKELIKADKEIMEKGYNEEACTVCGLSAVCAGIACLKDLSVSKAIILKSANSGDTEAGSKDRVVGYGAVAFIKKGDKMEFTIDDKAKKELLGIARKSIESYLETGKPKDFKPESKILYDKCAAFVTLREKGELRGCIGHLVAMEPLHETVRDMAIAAAFSDPRFSPVTKEELKDIKIEISVLSPLTRIKDAKEIVMGKHGVIVKKSGRSGVFLPQVATETGWTKEQFLNELCSQKAGLPEDAWKDKDTELYVFTVVLFEEK